MSGLPGILMALPFFGASIPGFVGLLTGRGPFSPAFALIPGRSILISLLEGDGSEAGDVIQCRVVIRGWRCR